ncbi:cytochrome P450 306a1 [Asbolus verrucosus]|uniref:Cytochrome P450 306a1 n=1 Tax=Asbolus verrucosus TaxID=1661398 RepID=A0A482VZS9_ASBVE|nr:cytochrome P450 306a1 [Asbolus verrucosus]
MEPIGLLLALLLVFFACRWYQKNRNLPPGPWNLPVIGYLAWLDPKSPYLTLTNLSRRYGPIYGLYLGSIYTVVVSDAKAVKKTFNKDAACGRAPLHLTHGIMKGYGLICAEGELWKDQRKFVHNTLRALGASRVGQNREKMQNLILDDVQELVQYIKALGDKAVVDPLELLRHNLGSVINKVVFGVSWPRDDETWKWLQDLQEEGTKLIGIAGPLNFLPFLRFLPKSKQTIRFLIEGKQKTHEMYKKIIDEQRELMKNGDEVSNFIQAFLAEKEKRRGTDSYNKFYNDEQFHHLLADIFGASLDTTLTTLRWYLLYLAAHEAIQQKIRQQLCDILGDNPPTLEDMSALSLLEASIAEVQRIRSVVPVGIPHGSLDQLEIAGYVVPKGTMIVPLQWAIHMNPEIWEEPDLYKPERFIDDQGKFFKPESFIPFQTGKRMCVGDELARMFLFLFGATLIQNFYISCEDKNNIDLNGDCGITLTPKPHKLVFAKL